MISGKIYASIVMLMASILFLCMSLNFVKDELNDYTINPYADLVPLYPSKPQAYTPSNFTLDFTKLAKDDTPSEKAAPAASSDDFVATERLVVCIGQEGPLQQVAEAWIAYTKRNMALYPNLKTYEAIKYVQEIPEMLILDPNAVDWQDSTTLEVLQAYLKQGTSLIFSGLPDPTLLKDQKDLCHLLGIRTLVQDQVQVDGFYLREGFLLGGSTFYEKPEDTTEEEEIVYPMDTTIPWYLPQAGTKVFMKGIVKDEPAENYPIVMWRQTYGNGHVFVELGEFLQSQMGLGILSAMAAQMHSYELYPIVNAQTMILEGFPTLTDENEEVIAQAYSRPLSQVHQEIIWPSISRLLQSYPYLPTCMMAPQFDYSQEERPDSSLLEYYLKMFSEDTVETGLDGLNFSNTPLLEKLAVDEQLFQESIGGYTITSFYSGDMSEEEILAGLQAPLLSKTKTVIRDYDETSAQPIGFLSENVTSQSTLGDSLELTYQSDFFARCMETALGYLSLSYDLSQVVYPQKEDVSWVELLDWLSFSLMHYGEQYPLFTKTTATEADVRIRNFLTLDFTSARQKNQIEVQTNHQNGSIWFILRTHEEAIASMEGGNWTQLEKGAYLIELTQNQATITLKPIDTREIT